MNIKTIALCVGGIGLLGTLGGCGGGGENDAGSGGGGNPPGNPLVSYVGTTNAFAAWADAQGTTSFSLPTGTYAGKVQFIRGTVDPVTGVNLGQNAGMEMYKGSDGHIYVVDLTATTPPNPVQVSSESAATVDDTCSLNGTNAPGANTDYLGVSLITDLASPTNTRYFYRLPGASGTCNTAGDIIRMVLPSTASNVAPTTVPGMPTTVVRNAAGGISGFVLKSGNNLVMYDANFANPVTLGSFTLPIGVATVMPTGTTQGYPTGQLYVIDGGLYYVNYAAQTMSGTLFAIPGWTPTNAHMVTAASPSTLYFAVNTAASGTTPASTSLYAMPADGSATPTLMASYTGKIVQLSFPYQSGNLIFSVEDGSNYTIYAMPQSGATPGPLVSVAENGGNFTATATSVYYTTWTQTTNNQAATVTRTGTQSGIVGVNGATIQSPVANTAFASGGEYQTWEYTAAATGAPLATVTQTPLIAVYQVVGLNPVSFTNTSNGYQYTFDGLGGGTLYSINTSTNQPIANLGVAPQSLATAFSASVRNANHVGFLDFSNYLSNSSPTVQDNYLMNSQTNNSLDRITHNL